MNKVFLKSLVLTFKITTVIFVSCVYNMLYIYISM